MNIQDFKDVLSVALQLFNLVIICYGGYKFLNKPHDTLADEVKKIEQKQTEQNIEIQELKKSLDSSHEKHREQKDTNEMFITCVLAFIDFEIAFCQSTSYGNTQDLYKAKETLQKYLARK